MEFIVIPDGKASTTSLKAKVAKIEKPVVPKA
jgi:hypothetical protein